MNTLATGVFIFCGLTGDGVDCERHQNEFDQQIWVSPIDWLENDLMFCDVIDGLIIDCNYQSLDHCHMVVDGHADCIMIDLEKLR